MMSVRKEIDRLKKIHGAHDASIMELETEFANLSQLEPQFHERTASSSDIEGIKKDTQAIRNALEIRGDISVNYDFVKIESIKKELYHDNLRMENWRLDLSKDSRTQFCNFGISAFYQIEGLLNYFYSNHFTNIMEVHDFIIQNTRKYLILENDDENAREAKRKKMELLTSKTKVYSITMAEKIYAFNNAFFVKNGDFFSMLVIDNLRILRNEDLHRSGGDVNTEKKYKDFLHNKNYEEIRDVLGKIAEVIKKSV